MIFVAESTDYWLNYGKDYAAGMGATVDPRIAAAQKRLASMKTGGQVQDETTALYQPAIGAAGRLGEDVNRVGMSGLSALGGLGASLPGFNPSMLADAARGTSRAGGSAALMGGVLGTNVQQNLATSIMENKQNLEGQRFLNEDKVVAAEEEKARLLADYLGYAQGGQAIETGTVNNLGTEASTAQTIAATPVYNEDGSPANAAAEQEQADLNLTQEQIAASKASTAKTIAETLGIEEQAAANLGLTLAQTDQINKMTPLQVDEAKANIQSIRNANKLSAAELKALPARTRMERLTAIANLKGINLNNALVVAELKKAGWSSSEINKAKTSAGGSSAVAAS
jgi:hypothetical protein